MRVLVTVVREGEEPQDVLVNTDDAATACDVAEVLAATRGAQQRQAHEAVPSVVVPMPGTTLDPRFSYAGQAPASPTLWADGHRCDPRTPVGSVLRDGMRISVDDSIGPLLRRGEPVGRYEVRVAGGASSGRVVRLAAGSATIGSAPTCTLPVADTQLPPLALRLAIDVQGRATVAPQPGAAVQLDDAPVTGEQDWPLGESSA